MSLVKPLCGLAILVSLIVGCSHPDERLVQLSHRANDQQERQNQQMASLQQEVAAGSRRLVELDGQARQEFLSMSHDLQQQSMLVANERDKLEAERKTLAQERLTAPLVATAITSASLILACALPLLLGALLLRPPSAPNVEALVDLLVDELASTPLPLPEPEPANRIPDGSSTPRMDEPNQHPYLGSHQ